MSTRLGSASCRADRFTDTLSGGPATTESQATTWRHASRSTHAPNGTIRPVSSASGTISAAPTSSPLLFGQRTSASTAVIAPSASRTRGW